MAFKETIEAMCEKAIRDGSSIMVRLPDTPSHYTQDMNDERLFQLIELVKRNGCQLSRVNLTDYKIHAKE